MGISKLLSDRSLAVTRLIYNIYQVSRVVITRYERLLSIYCQRKSSTIGYPAVKGSNLLGTLLPNIEFGSGIWIWPNLDPDPGPDPDPGIHMLSFFKKKKLKIFLENNNFLMKTIFF